MDLALFLHLYQPPTQFPDVLDQVVRESYQPICALLEDNPQAKVTLNLSASLIEQLSVKHGEVLASFRRLVERRQVELVGSAAYHPLLVRLPKEIIIRQITLNEITLNKYFGVVGPILKNEELRIRNEELTLPAQSTKSENPKVSNLRLHGFFPPEMAVSSLVLSSVKGAGYDYILADESVVGGNDNRFLREGHIFIDQDSRLTIVCRHRELSLAVAFSKVRTVSELLSSAKKNPKSPYLVLSMDGETFGHHRPEQMSLLRSLLSGGMAMISVSELLQRYPPAGAISVNESSWAESFERWDNRRNPIHVAQWELTNLAIEAVQSAKFKVQNENSELKTLVLNSDLLTLNFTSHGLETLSEEERRYFNAQNLLDRALHSDQFWWASHNPCWHYKMVQRGAALLLEAVEALPDDDYKSHKAQARELYKKITETSLSLYGDTVVAC